MCVKFSNHYYQILVKPIDIIIPGIQEQSFEKLHIWSFCHSVVSMIKSLT